MHVFLTVVMFLRKKYQFICLLRKTLIPLEKIEESYDNN